MIRDMKAALLLSLFAATHARALPGAIDLDAIAAGAQSAGFSPIAGHYVPPAQPPAPPAALVYASGAQDDARVDLAGLLDRHLTAADSFDDGIGRTFVSGTLDLAGDGWMAVTPPGQTPLLVKIERGMSAQWAAGGRGYSLDLDASIFRARLNNILEIKDGSGRTVWRRRIIELFQKTFEAGRPVVIGGRSYRLFVARMPDGQRPARPSSRLGLCLIYDQLDGWGRHDQYDFYRFPLEAMTGRRLDVALYGGDRASLEVSPDLSALTISR